MPAKLRHTFYVGPAVHGFVGAIGQCAKEQFGTGRRQVMGGFDKLPNGRGDARAHLNVQHGVQLVALR